MSNTISQLPRTTPGSNPLHQTIVRLQSGERGQSLMEMALVLLFLLSLTFGLIDFSRAIYTASVVKAGSPRRRTRGHYRYRRNHERH